MTGDGVDDVPALMMLFECKQEATDDLDRHVSLDYTSLISAVKTIESSWKEKANPDAACCHSHAEIKADVDAQMLSLAEREFDRQQV